MSCFAGGGRPHQVADSGNSHRLDGIEHAETFIILEGQLTFTIGDETIEAHADEIVLAPADTPHAFVNSGSGVLRSVNIHPVAEMQTEWL